MNSRAVNFQNELPLEDRLNVVRKAVRKATEEAVKQISTRNTSKDFPASSPRHQDPNAAFNLGMELFGQDIQIVQRNIREKLDQVEKDLVDIKRQIVRQATSQRNENNNNDQENIPVDDTAGKSKDTLQAETNLLTKKIQFLRRCSLARSFLDEATTLSKPALSSDPDWVEAARQLAKAEDALNEAQNVIINDNINEQETTALQAAYKIIDSIRASIRRERVDLIERAKALFDVCVTFSENGMAVRGPKASATASSATTRQGLQGVYDVLEALSSDEANSALKETLRRFTTTFYRQAIQPILDVTSDREIKPIAWSSPGKDNKGVVQNRTWNVRETMDENDSMLRAGRIKVKGPVHRLEWTMEETQASKSDQPANLRKESIMLENWKQTLHFLHRTMEFVHEHVLLERKNLCLRVGKQLFGKPDALPFNLHLEALGLESCMIGGNDNGLVMETLVEALAQTCIPHKLEPDELPELQTMAESLRSFTHPFIETMVEMNFIPPGSDTSEGSHGTRLEAFSTNFEQKYIDNRRTNVLNEARKLLLKNDYHNTIVTGMDVHEKKDKEPLLKGMDDGMSVFELHKSSISDTAFKLLQLCRSTMDEAVQHAIAWKGESNDSPLALLTPTLYRAARECLDLFRAITPATHGKEIATVPRTAGVFHNDCVYFQYHCLWLGLEFKSKLPPQPKGTEDSTTALFHQTCMFVDMVPLFRELADKSMGDMLDRQMHQIVDIVGKRITLFGQALRSDEVLAEWSEAETGLTAGLYHLRHLSDTWNVILSHDVFVRSIGHLADALFTLYLDQVTHARDISENACHFVSSLFQRATSTVAEILQEDTSGSLVWDRFQAVGRFMDMSLMDIQMGLADGAFRSVSAPELSRLVTATFADSPKRQRLLHALSSQ